MADQTLLLSRKMRKSWTNKRQWESEYIPVWVLRCAFKWEDFV